MSQNLERFLYPVSAFVEVFQNQISWENNKNMRHAVFFIDKEFASEKWALY